MSPSNTHDQPAAKVAATAHAYDKAASSSGRPLEHTRDELLRAVEALIGGTVTWDPRGRNPSAAQPP